MKSNNSKGLGFLIITLLIVLVFGSIFLFTMDTQTEISSTQFLINLESGKVEAVNITNDTVEVKYEGDDSYTEYFYSPGYSASTIEEFNQAIITAVKDSIYTSDTTLTEEELATAYANALAEVELVEILYNDRYAVSIWSYAYPVFALIFFIIMAIFLYRMISGQNKTASNFGKNKSSVQSNLKVRFTDVAGAEEEKVELAEIVEFLKAPEKFTKVGARIPHGVLLVGPPGTGKTLFAKAVAGEANVPFFSISGSDFVEMFVGVGASRVRDLFDQAHKNRPCIIFIDEIDAVGRQRGAGVGGGHDEREQTLNQLLVQMDGFDTNEGVIVMAATNRVDILDPALLRPGRFDRQVYVNIPDVRGREAIFKVHARNKPIAPDVDFQILARITSGFSGADIENLLNEASILCARDNRDKLSMEDLYEGINKVIMGPQKTSRLVTEVDKRITAYHEVGHALVAKMCKNCDPVHEVSIIPRGYAAGYTMTRPDNDNSHRTFNKLTDDLAMTMGGRAAEEIVIQDVSTGAVGDFKHATDVARKMVMEWGMSSSDKLGKVYYGSDAPVFLGRDYQSTHSYSEAVAGEIDSEVKRIVEKAYSTAIDILKNNRSTMDSMVRLLLERETIYSEEVDMIMDGQPYEKVRDALDERLAKKYNKMSSEKNRETPTSTTGDSTTQNDSQGDEIKPNNDDTNRWA